MQCTFKLYVAHFVCIQSQNWNHKNNIHKLIYEYQSGVLPKHSTVHQLNEFYNAILNSLENKEFSCFVFCDFAKFTRK
jgi:histidinol phosphatase-like enzyme